MSSNQRDECYSCEKSFQGIPKTLEEKKKGKENRSLGFMSYISFTNHSKTSGLMNTELIHIYGTANAKFNITQKQKTVQTFDSGLIKLV